MTMFGVLILCLHISGTYIERLSLPPGPIGVPLLGFLPFLGSQPHKDIAKLSDKYGPLFTLQLGVHNTVIVNAWESAKDTLLNDCLLDRPKESPFTLTDDSISFMDDSGQVWREHRKFAQQTFRDIGFGRECMEDKVVNEIAYLTALIDETDGRAFDLQTLLTPSVSNNVSQLAFGHRMDFNDPERVFLDALIDRASPLLSLLGVLAVSPLWLKSHQKTMDTNNKRDYIDGFLHEMEKRRQTDPNTSFTVKKCSSNARAFFGAGSETTRTAVVWTVLLATKHKDLQKRLHQEIDGVIGRDRSPRWADRLDMPYTQAFICEVFRWKPAVPLSLMRRASEDTYILGHFIPKDSRVLVNIWAVHHDHKLYQNPELFNPDRFLTNDGKNLIKTEALIPFSMGKRNCVGETLARVEVFLYLVSLLQRYTISAENEELLSLEDVFGLTLQPKESVILRFAKRL
ncbi:unnamed protein product [Medioppia subpectinata]|uniref:Cytochrome P450 n=1 Tax=Medioppia subpectinata TaxID=1979941 RepID=A0A7R9KLF0_9ACAR|nr:unnamed protein product [Medioppia subpectinata]CAG2104432.1 unnamed protein product [Medioppia subpectinata]